MSVCLSRASVSWFWVFKRFCLFYFSTAVVLAALTQLEAKLGLNSQIELVWLFKLKVLIEQENQNETIKLLQSIIQKKTSGSVTMEKLNHFHSEIFCRAVKLFEVIHLINFLIKIS